ncbi:unnamed protein product [Blumeria hordei]|uniref:Derlin n=1 Tax=Blumeria hordei TaxID=2867405 RepID=A0A383UIZ4_BLUHO|nr:unnamed protein product [Blumeria hordei]
MSSMDVFWAAPPISRTLAASAFLLSISVYTGFVPFHAVIFDPKNIWTFPPQLWRLVTPFLITGKELGIIFDTYFLYQYGSKLETSSPKFSQPGDFATYILFVSSVIVGLNMFIDGFIFTSALVLAFAYTSCQDDKGQKANFYIITIPALWVPYAMLLVNFLMAGPEVAKVQVTGLLAAHLHYFLTHLWPTFGGGRNLIPTPGFIRNIWEQKQPSTQGRGYSTSNKSFPPNSQSAPGRTNRILPQSWQSRGSGHRLGGN